jgi:hypothetical protein
MAITVACDCGKEFKVKDELAGKKVKCPACQAVLTVPAAEDAEPPRPRSSAAEDESEQAPREGKGGKKKAGGQKSKTMLFVGIGAGVLLLSCCCLGVGVGGWFFFLRSTPEKTIIGKWTGDADAMKKNLPKELQGPGVEELLKSIATVSVEIKSDNTLTITVPVAKEPITGKWKHLKTKDDTVTLDVTYDKEPPLGDRKKVQTQQIKVIDSNHIQVIDNDPNPPRMDMFLKRV